LRIAVDKLAVDIFGAASLPFFTGADPRELAFT
jgi:hypothetical protein